MQVSFGCDYVKNPSRQLHYAQAVLESPVSRARVHEIRHGQLMNVAQPLNWIRIQNIPLMAVQLDEHMDRVSYLVVRRGCQFSLLGAAYPLAMHLRN